MTTTSARLSGRRSHGGNPTEPKGRVTRWLNVYQRDLGYGGSEEGGWWYSILTPVSSRRMTGVTLTWARKCADRVQAAIPEPYYAVSSVMYAGDAYLVVVESHPARRTPRSRPYYE